MMNEGARGISTMNDLYVRNETCLKISNNLLESLTDPVRLVKRTYNSLMLLHDLEFFYITGRGLKSTFYS